MERATKRRRTHNKKHGFLAECGSLLFFVVGCVCAAVTDDFSLSMYFRPLICFCCCGSLHTHTATSLFAFGCSLTAGAWGRCGVGWGGVVERFLIL